MTRRDHNLTATTAGRRITVRDAAGIVLAVIPTTGRRARPADLRGALAIVRAARDTTDHTGGMYQ